MKVSISRTRYSDQEDTPSEFMKCRKIKIVPSKNNKFFDDLGHGARFMYNKTVDLINELNSELPKFSEDPFSSFKNFDKKNLRKLQVDDEAKGVSKKAFLKMNIEQRKELLESKDYPKKLTSLLTPKQLEEIRLYRGDIKKSYSRESYSKQDFRNLLCPEETLSHLEILEKTPFMVREGAIFECVKNLQVCLTNLKRGNIRHFKLKHKKKKNLKYTIAIRRNIIILNNNKITLHDELSELFKISKFSKTKKIKIELSQEIKDNILSLCFEIISQDQDHNPFDTFEERLRNILNFDFENKEIFIKNIFEAVSKAWTNRNYSKSDKFSLFPGMNDNAIFSCTSEIPEITNDSFIHFDGFNHWLILPYKAPKSKNKGTHVLSTDPGVRTFQTVYCPDGFVMGLGEGSGAKLRRIKEIINNKTRKLKQNKSKKEHKKRNKALKRAILKLRKRMENLQTELHNKTCNFLTKIGATICLPEFAVKKMTKKEKRKIGKKTVVEMLCLAHYKFKLKMITKSRENNCVLLITKEPYTTKTCGECGKLNDPGSSKIYSCKFCNLIIGRDESASRNNLLCNLEYSWNP